jgi:hypothetical protein
MLTGHVVQAATLHQASSTIAAAQDHAKEIERLRTALAVSEARVDSLTWVLRMVRRKVDWDPFSPTLRLVEQAIAGTQTVALVERTQSGTKLRSV